MLRSVARLRRMAAGTSLRRLFISTTSAASMRDVRARADGDADVRAGERGSVVDAVADHGDLAALAQAADLRFLAVGQYAGDHAGPRPPAAPMACAVRSLSPVSMTTSDAHIPQLAHGLRAVGLDDVRHGDDAERVCRLR